MSDLYFSVFGHDDTKDSKANKYRSVYNELSNLVREPWEGGCKPKIIAIHL